MKIIIGFFALLLVGIVIVCLVELRPAFRVGDRVQVALEWRAPLDAPTGCATVVSGATLGSFGLNSSRFVTIKFDGGKNPSHEFDPIYNVDILEPCSMKE